MIGIAYYLIFISLVMEVLPSDTYEKYVRVVTGVILLVLILSMVESFLGNDGTNVWKELKQRWEVMEQEIKIPEKDKEQSIENHRIEVEAIRID